MKYSEDLAELERSVAGCLHCNSCHFGNWPENKEICPIYSRDHTFTNSAGGLMYLAKALLRGQLEYSEHLSELVYSCTACRGCDDRCTMMRAANGYMPLSDIIRLMKYELVKRDLAPENLNWIRNRMERHGDLCASDNIRPMVPESIRDDDSDTVLYAACFHHGPQAKVFSSAVSLLEKMRQRVSVFADDGCCGSTLFDHGFWDDLPRLVNQKAEKMQARDGRTFLFVNPHCQEFTTNRYPIIAEDFAGIRGRHISELLADALKDGRLKGKAGRKVKVAYHDPCMLGRGLGITEPPREALSCLDGVELVEMDRNRQNSFCCGSKAAGEYVPDYRNETARERIAEFEDSGADVLITACHYCKTMFQGVLGEDAGRVKDLCEFVDGRTG